MENKVVVKWPDKIEERLKKEGIKYEFYGDADDILDIEANYRDFFEKW